MLRIVVKMNYEQRENYIQTLISEVFSEDQPEERIGKSSDNEEDHVSESGHDTDTDVSADSSDSDGEPSDVPIDHNVILVKTKSQNGMIHHGNHEMCIQELQILSRTYQE